MANDEDEKSTAEKVERGVGGVFRLLIAFLILLGVVLAWGSTGYYQLQPGEAAVVLRLGAFNRAEFEPGPKLHLPYPIESHQVIEYDVVRREKFGYSDVDEAKPGQETATFETAIQTADNNIVNLSYVVQYKIGDPFAFTLGIAKPESVMRDAAQAAVREVVARRTADQVLSSDRGGVQSEAKTILEETLDSYFGSENSAFNIRRVELQIVQPPTPVQEAFDDVVAAQQDDQRSVAEARGDAREILERASAKASEMREQASAYKEALVLEAKGEADRFVALLDEYKRAPEVTRSRLYLETMEEILPGVEKVIIQPDAANFVPYFPLDGQRSVAGGAKASGAQQ